MSSSSEPTESAPRQTVESLQGISMANSSLIEPTIRFEFSYNSLSLFSADFSADLAIFSAEFSAEFVRWILPSGKYKKSYCPVQWYK